MHCIVGLLCIALLGVSYQSVINALVQGITGAACEDPSKKPVSGDEMWSSWSLYTTHMLETDPRTVEYGLAHGKVNLEIGGGSTDDNAADFMPLHSGVMTSETMQSEGALSGLRRPILLKFDPNFALQAHYLQSGKVGSGLLDLVV